MQLKFLLTAVSVSVPSTSSVNLIWRTRKREQGHTFVHTKYNWLVHGIDVHRRI